MFTISSNFIWHFSSSNCKSSLKMPKQKENLAVRATKLIRSNKCFEVETISDGVFIFCKYCECKFKIDATHLNTQIQSHLATAKHKKSKERQILQPSIAGAIVVADTKKKHENSYSLKLARAFLEAGIPLWKLRHPSIKNFFYQEHKEILPCSSTFYKKIEEIHSETLEKIKNNIGVSPIYFICDETTDAKHRYALNVLVGKLNGEPSAPMLLSTIFLEKTNNTTVQQGLLKATTTLYGANIPFERVRFLITDQAPYMIKAGKGLKVLFPNLKHVSCLVHGLNRVSEVIKDRSLLANIFISKMKAVLAKSHVRRQMYSEICRLPFPPDVIEIRWNTWLNAAFFYAEHFSSIKTFVLALDNDSKAVEELQNCIKKVKLQQELAEIHNFKFLTEAITRLEKRGMSVPEQITVLSSVKSKLTGVELAKLEDVLSKNPDVDFWESLPVDLQIKYKYVPLTSVDVERSFSIYRHILSDRRYSLTESNLAMLNVIQYNNFVNDNE